MTPYYGTVPYDASVYQTVPYFIVPYAPTDVPGTIPNRTILLYRLRVRSVITGTGMVQRGEPPGPLSHSFELLKHFVCRHFSGVFVSFIVFALLLSCFVSCCQHYMHLQGFDY